MTDRQLQLRLGIFAVLALILLGTMIVLFNSLPQLFKSTNEYTVTFPSAPGLRPGSPVRLYGIRVGEVKDVVLDDANSQVKARIEIEKKYTVRRNEVPTIIVSTIGSDVNVDFIPQKVVPPEEPDREPIPPGSEIAGKTQSSVNALINRVSEVVPTTQETMEEIRKSLKRLDELTPLMRETLTEYRDLGRQANKEFPLQAKLLQDTLQEYRNLGHQANEMTPLMRETLTEYRNLGHQANEEFPSLTKSLRGSSDDFGATAREWRRLGENLNVLLLGNQDKIVKALDNVNLTLDRVLSLLSDANIKDLTAIIQNIRDVSVRAVSIARNLQSASEDAPAITKNTREASEHFPSIAKNSDELMKESRATLARLQQTLAKAEAAMADLQKTSQLFSERGPAISKNLDESMDKLNRTLTDVRELVRVIGQSDGSFKRFITDPSLYNNVDQSACAIAKLMPRLDRILKDLETFADKLARHPEQLGVPGIIKPGSGLKEQEPIGTHPH